MTDPDEDNMIRSMYVIRGVFILSLLLLNSLAGWANEVQGKDATERIPDGLKLVSMEAHPPSIVLDHRFAYTQLLLTGRLDTGDTLDVTRAAQLASTQTIVLADSRRLVTPLADGEGKLVFTLAGATVTIPILVSGSQEEYDVSFVGDVMPAMSKLGCNAGTCHGNKDGQNGFKLSLRGYDAQADHRTLTDELASRRFNRVAPDQSLMLLKASGSIPHVGSVLTKPGESYYEVLRQWIAAGAQFDPDAARVESIEVLPTDPTVPQPGMKQQIAVLATYSDGAVRDVTREAFIESGNTEVAEADGRGLISLIRRGEAAVLARYEGSYAATTITVMGDRSGFVWYDPPSYNYIDRHINNKLKHVRISPGELCTDAEFIRRVYLDLIGLPPQADEVRLFLSDSRPPRVKREELIDQLVGSAEFIEHWTNKWADLLQVNRKFLGQRGAMALRDWIKHSVATNKPYDHFVREIITATGSNLENPPAAYWKILRDPAVAMENTTHLFLATRFNCNKCHDHPFERWTQDQYYHLAAYFAQVGRKVDPAYAGQQIGGSAVEKSKPMVEVIFDQQSGEIKHDRTGATAEPAFPYEHADVLPADAPWREQLAQWITSRDNPYFARSYVNRLWGYLFGRGIIEPIDDIRAGNPPTHPRLLDALTEDFVEGGFDAQRILSAICKSRTYQLSLRTNRWNADDEINCSHAIPRRLPAEVLYDAVHVATGSIPKIPGVPVGMRAAELPDVGVKVPFLDDFGRPVRESACECERSTGIVLGPIMKLINGPTVATAIADPENALTRLVSNQTDDEQIVEELFLRFYARLPREEEIELCVQSIRSAQSDHTQRVAELEAYQQTLLEKQAQWENHTATGVTWTVLDPAEITSSIDATFSKQDDASLLVSGNHGQDTYEITVHTEQNGITGVRLESMADPSLPAGGPGRAPDGNFVLSEFRLHAASRSEPEAATPVTFDDAHAEFSQNGRSASDAIDGNQASGWAVAPRFNQSHTIVFQTHEDIGHEGGTELTFRLDQNHDGGKHSLGRFRLAVTTSPRPIRIGNPPDPISAILAIARDARSPEQSDQITKYYFSLDLELARLTALVEQSADRSKNLRLLGVQDLAWALINTPAFLFNR